MSKICTKHYSEQTDFFSSQIESFLLLFCHREDLERRYIFAIFNIYDT